MFPYFARYNFEYTCAYMWVQTLRRVGSDPQAVLSNTSDYCWGFNSWWANHFWHTCWMWLEWVAGIMLRGWPELQRRLQQQCSVPGFYVHIECHNKPQLLRVQSVRMGSIRIHIVTDQTCFIEKSYSESIPKHSAPCLNLQNWSANFNVTNPGYRRIPVRN